MIQFSVPALIFFQVTLASDTRPHAHPRPRLPTPRPSFCRPKRAPPPPRARERARARAPRRPPRSASCSWRNVPGQLFPPSCPSPVPILVPFFCDSTPRESVTTSLVCVTSFCRFFWAASSQPPTSESPQRSRRSVLSATVRVGCSFIAITKALLLLSRSQIATIYSLERYIDHA